MNDIFSFAKGPYYRLVGRYTQRYLSRAAGMSGNDLQKKVLFIAVAGVDEYFSKRFNVRRNSAKSFAKAPIEKHLKKQQINTAFRIYLSTLLILLGTQKEHILEGTGLSETAWIHLWRKVFDYHAEDLACFNQELMPNYQEKDPAALSESSFRLISQTLSSAGSDQFFLKETDLRDTLMQDLAAILRALCPQKGA